VAGTVLYLNYGLHHSLGGGGAAYKPGAGGLAAGEIELGGLTSSADADAAADGSGGTVPHLTAPHQRHNSDSGEEARLVAAAGGDSVFADGAPPPPPWRGRAARHGSGTRRSRSRSRERSPLMGSLLVASDAAEGSGGGGGR